MEINFEVYWHMDGGEAMRLDLEVSAHRKEPPD
jgi:hypothetical protein